MNVVCNKCEKYGLVFRATNILPVNYIEGNPNSKIWIIGLNPKGAIGNVESRTLSEFEILDPDCHSYFKDFKKVSSALYSNWKSEKSTIAHTDLIKCFSPSFPPIVKIDNIDKQVKIDVIIKNCKDHLRLQLINGRPKVVICNGSQVCEEILKLFPPQNIEEWHKLTSYSASINLDNNIEHKFRIVLSGYIGRIDDRNKRRLGLEIEQIIKEEGIEL